MIGIRRQLYLATFLLLAACATSEGPAPKGGAAPVGAAGPAAFRTADFAWSTAAGRGAIEGQVTYGSKRAPYGCSTVVLTPETPWVRQRMSILYKSTQSAALPADEVRQRTPPERSQDYSSYVKRTSCDATGKFAFSGLPDGSWFVITVVKPAAPGAGPDMAIMRRVSVTGGRSVSVRL